MAGFRYIDEEEKGYRYVPGDEGFHYVEDEPKPEERLPGIVAGIVGSQMKRGWMGSEAGFFQTLAGSFKLVGEAGPEDTRDTDPLAIGLKGAEGWAQGWADYFRSEMPPEAGGEAGKALETLGGLPLQIGETAAAYATGGPGGLAALGALQGETPGERVKGAVLGLGGGIMAKTGARLPVVQRAVAELAGGAGQIHATGGGLREQATGAALSALGARTAKPKRIRTIVDKAGNINLRYLDTEENIKTALRTTAQEGGEFMDARRGVRTHEATLEAAQALGMDEKELLKRRKGQAFNAEEATRARQLLVGTADDLVARAAKITRGPASDADIQRFLESWVRHAAVQEQVSGMTSEAGRALESFKIKIPDQAARQRQLEYIMRDFMGGAKPEDLAQMIVAIDTPEGVAKFTGKLSRAKTGDQVLEAWINGILSGPQTHVINVTSNALVAAYTAGPETLVAAGIGRVLGTKDPVRFRESLAKVNGMRRAMPAALGMLRESFLTEEGIGAEGKIEAGRQKAIPGTLGKVIRVPGRALTAEDTFFKVLNYAGEVEALATRQAVKEGLKGEAMAARVAELVADPPPAIAGPAWETARVNTFTNDLGKFGNWLLKGKADHKALNAIMPFVRTPGNIIKFGMRRTPAGVMMPSFWNEISAGGARRDKALAQIALGSTIQATLATYVVDGTISGGGPRDKDERAGLYRTGWSPYAIKIGGEWHQYNRLEPMGMMIGAVADFVEVAEFLPEKTSQEIAAKIGLAISSNLTSKSWLQGPAALIEALEDPARFGERYFTRLLSSAVPAGSAQAARVFDSYLRDSQSMLDAFKERMPGARETIPLRLDLWGQPIPQERLGIDLFSPIAISKDKNDKVANEMVRIEYFPGMPPRELNGVALTQDQYWEFVKAAGEPAKRILDRSVSDRKWDGMHIEAKRGEMKAVVDAYREAAAGMMLFKYPALQRGKIEQAVGEWATPRY